MRSGGPGVLQPSGGSPTRVISSLEPTLNHGWAWTQEHAHLGENRKPARVGGGLGPSCLGQEGLCPAGCSSSEQVTGAEDSLKGAAPHPVMPRAGHRGGPPADGQPTRGHGWKKWPQEETVLNGTQATLGAHICGERLDLHGIGSRTHNDTSGPCSKHC